MSTKLRSRITFILLLALIVLLSTITLIASAEGAEKRTLEVFVRDGCPHCAEAKLYLPKFAVEHPELEIIYRPVDQDVNARDDLVRYSKNAGMWPPGVPTFVIDGKVLVGFKNAELTGPELEALVAQNKEESGQVETKLFGTLSVSRLGLPLFTLAIGLLDGFNPCAMWVLLFLLSMLVHMQDRKRMALIAGTFVFVSGAVSHSPFPPLPNPACTLVCGQ